MTRAGTADSGNYTCLPSRGEAVSADVHIITGEFYVEPFKKYDASKCLPTEATHFCNIGISSRCKMSGVDL